MGIMEWIDGGMEIADFEKPAAMKGSFGVTIGDAVAGFFGARYTHIFGSEVKLVCDPEDMLFGQLEHYLPLTSALLGGIGGQATFVYGSNIGATYWGPKVEIRRAPTHNKCSDYILPHAKFIGPVPNPASGLAKPVDPIDEAMCAAVAVLSVLVCVVPAALELAIRFKYPAYGSSTASPTTLEGYGETPSILKLCAYGITSRLMALLKLLEEKGTWADFAEFWIKVGEYFTTKDTHQAAQPAPVAPVAAVVTATAAVAVAAATAATVQAVKYSGPKVKQD